MYLSLSLSPNSFGAETKMTTTATAATTRLVSGRNNSETGWHLDKGLLEEQNAKKP